jgi:hypothetical protein
MMSEVMKMTIDVFWQRIEGAIRCDDLSMCPVKEYAKETNTERMCDHVGDCADGLMMLHKKLQSEERQKMERGEDGV